MANSYVNSIGQRFGHLVVLGDAPKTGVHRKVTAQCDCGTIKDYVIYNLRNGHTISCGCVPKVKEKHGYAKAGQRIGNATYAVYRDMRTRCENPNYREFHLYGGRGIAVCDRWRESFENFLRDMGERPVGMTLERKRVNEGYSPDNCCWATAKEQSLNRRSNVFIELDGRRQTASQWAEELGMDSKLIYARVKYGWPPERILKP